MKNLPENRPNHWATGLIIRGYYPKDVVGTELYYFILLAFAAGQCVAFRCTLEGVPLSPNRWTRDPISSSPSEKELVDYVKNGLKIRNAEAVGRIDFDGKYTQLLDDRYCKTCGQKLP